MLNSYPIYNHHASTTNIRRNSFASTLPLTKYRRNSFSPATPLILSQGNFDELNEDYFSSSSLPIERTASETSQTKTIESEPTYFPSTKDDGTLSLFDGLELPSNLISNNVDLPLPSTSTSNIQCVRIIRRTDTVPILNPTPSNSHRVVRVIRLSNTTSRTNDSSTGPSNVYIVRKSDLPPPPPVQINPAVQQLIAKTSTNQKDENIQLNKLYGSTISIFGIEFTVVSNETNPHDQRASLVQNFVESNAKTTVSSTTTNKINDIHKLFSRIYRCVLCSAEFDLYDDFVAHGSGHLQDLTLKPLETSSVFRRRSYRCLLPHCHTRIESETESPRIVDQLFRRHLLSHVGTHPFQCHLCKSKFQRIQNYRVHLAYHEEINSPSFQCTKCLKKFSAEKQYNCHLRKCFVVPPPPTTSSASLTSFRCQICGENFEKDLSLSLHMKHIHGSRPSTPSVTAIRSDNEVRVRLVSPVAVPNKSKSPPRLTNICQICHEEFPKRLLYKKHMLTHLGEKHFACTYPACKDTFYTQSNLDRHIRTVHLRTNSMFTCTFPNCGKSFTRNDSLKTHRIKHFPNMIMKCPYVDCEEKFRVRSTYHAHIKRHRTEKQPSSTIYVCVLQNCQYTTSNKASMKQHLTKIHDYKQEKDEDIPYLQYPSKQPTSTPTVPNIPPTVAPSTIHLDEPIAPNIVDVSAPLVVKLTSDEPIPATTLVVPHSQPLSVVPTTSIPAPPQPSSSFSFNDPFEMFRPNIVLGDLDWLNIESEENIRPRKRQNIITISRDMESLSTVVVENLSGCARTDYRSNHALLERAKFRRKLLNYKRELLRVDSQSITTSNSRRVSCQLSDENDDDDDDDDILETTTLESSPKRMKINEIN